jgi:hypothetical protein
VRIIGLWDDISDLNHGPPQYVSFSDRQFKRNVLLSFRGIDVKIWRPIPVLVPVSPGLQLKYIQPGAVPYTVRQSILDSKLRKILNVDETRTFKKPKYKSKRLTGYTLQQI